MLTIHQRLDLPQPRNRHSILRIFHLQPLQRDDLARPTVLGARYPSIRSLFYIVQFLIVFHAATFSPAYGREAEEFRGGQFFLLLGGIWSRRGGKPSPFGRAFGLCLCLCCGGGSSSSSL